MRGLEALSLGELAKDLELSKSGVAAAFGSKQELQLATVAAARQVFVEHVVAPALRRPAGLPRLWGAVDAWLEYVRSRVFPGGCFMVAVLPEFDTQPGPVRDALAAERRAWLDFLAEQVVEARRQGRDVGDAQDVAVEIDALLSSANLARNLGDGDEALDRVRRLISRRLGPPPRQRPRGRVSPPGPSSSPR